MANDQNNNNKPAAEAGVPAPATGFNPVKSTEGAAPGSTGGTDKKPVNKGGNNNKNKGNKPQGKDKGSKDYPPRRKSNNDYDWYLAKGADAGMLEDAGRVNFNHQLGAPFSNEFIKNKAALTGFGTTERSVPGLCSMHFIPAFGISTDANAPINVAARKYYVYIRHTLSSSSSAYEAPDLMVYMGAVDSLYAYVSYLKQVYATVAEYNTLNRYYGRALCTAMGVNYDDLIIHLSDLRKWLNVKIDSINKSLFLPTDLGFIKRHSWMCRNFFLDGKTYKAQMYVFKPDGFYRWDPITFSTGSSLKLMPLAGNATFAQLVAYMDSLLDPLLMDQDTATIMSGEILRAYGDSEVYQLKPCADDEPMGLDYNEEILLQIHNAEFCGVDTGNTNYHQVSGGGAGDLYLVSDIPVFNSTQNNLRACLGHVLDSFNDWPQSKEVVLSTRNQLGLVSDADGSNIIATSNVTLTSCGLDIMTFIAFYYYDGLTLRNVLGGNAAIYWDQGIADYTTVESVAAITSVISKFDWAPRIPIFEFPSDQFTDTNVDYWGDIWDYTNYTVYGDDVIENLHRAVLLGAFGVPPKTSAYKK